MASQVRRVAGLEQLSQEQLTSGGELLETAGARGREGGDGDEAGGLDPVVPSPGGMDDEDVTAADLKDVGRRAAIRVSLIKLGLKSHGEEQPGLCNGG